MAGNVNKIIYGDETLMDLTEDTVTEEQVLEGAMFHNSAGEKKTGTLAPLATSVNEEHFNIDESKQLSLSSDVTKKLPNAVPTSADAGFAPVVQSDGSVKWQKVSGGGGAKLVITCTAGEIVVVTDLTETKEVFNGVVASGELVLDAEVAHTYTAYQHNADSSKVSEVQSVKITELVNNMPPLSYFTAYIDIAGDPNLTVSATNGTSTYSGSAVIYDGSKYVIRVGEYGTFSVTATKGKATRTVNNITVPNTPNRHTTAPALQSFGYVMVDASSDFAQSGLTIDVTFKGSPYDSITYNGSPLEVVFADNGKAVFSATALDGQEYSLDVDVALGETLNKTIETKVTIELDVYSASNDTIVVTKGGENLGTCVTDISGKGTFTVEVLPSGENITFTSTDIDKVDGSSGKYEVTVNISKSHTVPIKVMPEGALFWYGYVDDRIEDMVDSAEWLYGTRGYTKIAVDFSIFRSAKMQVPNISGVFSGLGTKESISGYSKCNVNVINLKEADSVYNSQKNLETAKPIGTLKAGQNTFSIVEDKIYAIYVINLGRYITISAWWLE